MKSLFKETQWRIHTAKFWTRASRSNFLRFHAVFDEIWPNNRLARPFGLGAPRLGDPGSIAETSTVLSSMDHSYFT